MGNFVAIDGSLVAFRASAAGEKRTIKVTHRETKKSRPFDNRTDFKKHLKSLNEKREEKELDPLLVTDYEVEDVITPPEVNISLHVCKVMIADILSVCEADDYIIYLDEGKTFRNRIATVQEYKGNRIDKVKPINLQAVKDYMVLYYKTKVITEIEADDYVNFWQYKGWLETKKGGDRKYIAVTFDKDAFGNPGWVYDFRKDGEGKPIMKEPIWIDGLGEIYKTKSSVKGKGRKFFYFQWLAGDSADNYKPNKLCGKRFGEQAALKILDPLKTDKQCIQAIADQYFEWYSAPTTYTTWDGKEITKDWIDVSQEYFDLARMLRWKTDEVNVEDIFKKNGVNVNKGRR